jgi:glycosyltransferase involved in cell wall biosynthesis
MFRVGILSTHPIQYYSPWYRALSREPGIDLTVYYAHRQTAEGQAAAGFGVAFEWDVPLLDGYRHQFLRNVARNPNVGDYRGCDTPEIAEVITRERFDAFIVHGWYNRSYWQAIRACWRTGTPLMCRGDSQLCTPRSHLRRFLKRWLYRSFIPRFDAYLVVGQRAREYYLAYGADADRMYFVPHFVDNAYFARAAAELLPRRAELRRQYELGREATVFLFAGKFIAKKRPLDFVNAVTAARRRHIRLEGAMVGDGPLRPAVEAAVADRSAPVRLCGFRNQSQIAEAYVASDAIVLPSDGGETWGLVVNEAMACGRPAIVSNQVGCAPDLVVDGQTGYVFPCGSVEALADRMVRLATDSGPPLAALSQGARERVESYSVERAVGGTCAALASLGRTSRTTLAAAPISAPKPLSPT